MADNSDRENSKKRSFAVALLIIVAGTMSALALPPVSFFPIYLISFSVFILLLTRFTHSKRSAFFYGWSFGLGYFCAGLYWISNALLVHGDEFLWALPFSFFGLPIVISCFFGAASLMAWVLSKANKQKFLYLFLPLLGLSEILRGILFTGFPWNSFGLIWADHLWMANAAAFIGLEGLTLLSILWGSLLAVILHMRSKTLHRETALCFIVITALSFASCAGLSALNISQISIQKAMQIKNASNTASFDIRVVQPNIPQIEKWDSQYYGRNFARLIELSLPSAEAIPTKDKAPLLIVWPETALPYFLYERPILQAQIREMLSLHQRPTYLAFGFLDQIKNAKDKNAQHRNSIIIIDSSLNVIARYDKHHLVPFGEYMPFADLIPIGPLVNFSGFEAGKAPESFTLEHEGLFTSILPLICYEIIFQRYSRGSKGLILNVTNDAWYGNSAGPYQHFAITRMRAIETSSIVMRSANTGISAIIMPDGSVTEDKILKYGKESYIEHSYHNHDVSYQKTYYQKYRELLLLLYFSIYFALFGCVLRLNI